MGDAGQQAAGSDLRVRVSARAFDLVKVYGTGDTEVRTLDGVSVDFPHDPVNAGYANRVPFLADGRIVDEMAEPTAERVLDRLKDLGE